MSEVATIATVIPMTNTKPSSSSARRLARKPAKRMVLGNRDTDGVTSRKGRGARRK